MHDERFTPSLMSLSARQRNWSVYNLPKEILHRLRDNFPSRLTYAFSKKMENHCHAFAIYFMHYNFARVHQTFSSVTAAGVREKL